MVGAWLQGSKTRQRICHFFVKDTWTNEFLVLSCPRCDKTPRAELLQALQAAGLGKKKVVFKDKNGNFDHSKSPRMALLRY